MVQEAWGWVILRLFSLLPKDCAKISNFEFARLMFLNHFLDKEAVWLLGTYIQLVWVEKIQNKRKIKLNHLIGDAKFMYQGNQVSRKPFLESIAYISKLFDSLLLIFVYLDYLRLKFKNSNRYII